MVRIEHNCGNLSDRKRYSGRKLNRSGWRIVDVEKRLNLQKIGNFKEIWGQNSLYIDAFRKEGRASSQANTHQNKGVDHAGGGGGTLYKTIGGRDTQPLNTRLIWLQRDFTRDMGGWARRRFQVLSLFLKLNSFAFSCSLANLFSYADTFFRVGLMNLPRRSLT